MFLVGVVAGLGGIGLLINMAREFEERDGAVAGAALITGHDDGFRRAGIGQRIIGQSGRPVSLTESHRAVHGIGAEPEDLQLTLTRREGIDGDDTAGGRRGRKPGHERIEISVWIEEVAGISHDIADENVGGLSGGLGDTGADKGRIRGDSGTGQGGGEGK